MGCSGVWYGQFVMGFVLTFLLFGSLNSNSGSDRVLWGLPVCWCSSAVPAAVARGVSGAGSIFVWGGARRGGFGF